MDEQQQQHPKQQSREQTHEWTTQAPTQHDRALQVSSFLVGLAGTGVVDLVVHGGVGGLVFGAAAALILAKSAPDAYAQVKDVLPWHGLQEVITRHEPGSRSVLDRMRGRHDDEELQEREEPGQFLPEAGQVREHAAPARPSDAPVLYDPRLHTQHLYLGQTLFPHANLVLSNRMAILGMPNAGKSNTVAVLVEELARFGTPLIVFDLKPEYERLCSTRYLPSPFRASAKNVTAQNAFAFGRQIMRKRLQVVLDLRSYKDDSLAALVMIEIVEGIYSWQSALPNDDRLPCMVVLEEAHYWLSQGQPLSTVSRKEDRQTGVSLYERLQTTFFNLVNVGRSFGMGSIISTQRPANVDKRAIAVAEWKILMKANMPNDLKVYEGMGLKDEVARELERGEAFVIGPGMYAEGSIHLFRKRNSPDDAKTPGLEALQKPPSMLAPVPSAEESREPASRSRSASTPAAHEALLDLYRSGELSREVYVMLRERLEGDEPMAPPVTPQYYPVPEPYVPVSTVYSEINDKQADKQSVYRGVNAPVEASGKVIEDAFTDGFINESTHAQKTERAPVNDDIRKHIRRMSELGYSHRDISKVVRLYGPKYALYKRVCAEEGIKIEREA